MSPDLVPLIYRMPPSLSSVLHVSDFCHACSCDAKHLELNLLARLVGQGEASYGEHDPIWEEGFEWDAHSDGSRGV